MKRTFYACIIIIHIILFVGCAGITRFVLTVNGERTYITDVFIEEEYVVLPFSKCFRQLGAKWVLDSPYDAPHRIILDFYGERYVLDYTNRLFVKEKDFEFIEGKEENQLEAYSTSEHNLIPYYLKEHKERGANYIGWNAGEEVYVGNTMFIEIMSKLGCTVTIEWNAEEQMVYISSISQNPEDG